MFILALNSLSLTPGTNPSDFPLVLLLPGLGYRGQVLKENTPHFILAHSILKKKPTEDPFPHSQILQPRSKRSPPHPWRWGGILFILADNSLTVRIRGEWMDSVRGTWGYKSTGKSCWCFSKYLDLQKATEQFQGIIS